MDGSVESVAKSIILFPGSPFYHGACSLCIKKAPNQAKIYHDLIKMVSITLEGLWMVSDKIVDFRFFFKFHRSGPAIIFSF